NDEGFGTQLGRNHTRTARTLAGAAFTCARRKARRQEAAIVQKQRCETSSGARPRGVAANPGYRCRRAAPKKATAGPAWRRPGPFLPGAPLVHSALLPGLPRKYATHSPAPTTRDWVNVSQTPLLAPRRRSGRPRCHPGGRRPASAARRACRRLVILEVRRVL